MLVSAVTGEGVEAVLRALVDGDRRRSPARGRAEARSALGRVTAGSCGDFALRPRRNDTFRLFQHGESSRMTSLSLKKYRRITVKIGSALLVDRASGLKRDWLASLAADIGALARGRRGRAGRLVRRHRAWPHHPVARQAGAEARGKPGGGGRRPDRAGRRLGGGARQGRR